MTGAPDDEAVLVLFIRRSGQPGLTTTVFALRPVRDLLRRRTQPAFFEADGCSPAIASCPVFLLAWCRTGSPRLPTLVLAAGPCIHFFHGRLIRVVAGNVQGIGVHVAPP